MGRPVDRSVVKMIAYKRLITGSLAMTAGCITTYVGVANHHAMSPQLFLALAIFFGGGAWALRDGLRLRRELAR